MTRCLLTSAGPRVAEAIFAHVTSAASTVCANGVGKAFRRQTARGRAVELRKPVAGFSLDTNKGRESLRVEFEDTFAQSAYGCIYGLCREYT